MTPDISNPSLGDDGLWRTYGISRNGQCPFIACGVSAEQCTANAALIAAAPELLETCKALLSIAEKGSRPYAHEVGPEVDAEFPPDTLKAFTAARAIIADAE